MNPSATLKLETLIIVITIVICWLVFSSQADRKDFDNISWSSVSKNLISIQEQCRNSRAIRQANDSIELIASNGDLLILSIVENDSEQVLKLERRSLTRIKSKISIKEFHNITLEFKQSADGLPDQDLTLKALYKDPIVNKSIAILVDFSLSNPRLLTELQL